MQIRKTCRAAQKPREPPSLEDFDHPPEDWASCEPLHDCFLAVLLATASGVCYLAPWLKLLLELLTTWESCILTAWLVEWYSLTKLYLITLKVVWGPQLRSFSQQPSQNEHGTLSHGSLHWDHKWKTMKLFCGLFFGPNMGHFQSKLLTSKVWCLVDSMPFEPTWRSSCIFSFVCPLVIFI